MGKYTLINKDEVRLMIGLMLNQMEQKEIEYVIKRELDEILFDLQDDRLDLLVKRTMDERYKILFNLFKRIAPAHECLLYMRNISAVKKKT
jgi:hypothetical protein